MIIYYATIDHGIAWNKSHHSSIPLDNASKRIPWTHHAMTRTHSGISIHYLVLWISVITWPLSPLPYHESHSK